MLSADEIVCRLGDDCAVGEKLSVIPKPDTVELEKRGGTSLDLRLGRWFRSFKQDETSSVPLAALRPREDSIDLQSEFKTREHFIPFSKAFVLHPGRFVLGATLEWIRLPKDLSGYVSGKSSLGRHGLVIETAAGIHPSFSGCLTLELANVGEVPLQIFPGMQICQIFLHRTKPGESSDIGHFSGSRKPSVRPPSRDRIFDRLVGQG